jgi:hypothetical protein
MSPVAADLTSAERAPGPLALPDGLVLEDELEAGVDCACELDALFAVELLDEPQAAVAATSAAAARRRHIGRTMADIVRIRPENVLNV